MTNIPLVSIIIPVHNPGKLLDVCLQSVIEQSYKNIEIIVVNDDSSDDSESIIKGFQKKDSRIKYFYTNQHNAAFTRREGIKESSAKYVCFVDSDDVIDKQYVQVLYETLIETGVEIATAKIANFTCNEDMLVAHNDSGKTQINDNLLKYFADNYHSDKKSKYISQSINAKIFKKDLFENLDYTVIKTRILEDNFIVPQILKNSKLQKIAMIDKTLYFYRSNQNSTMAMSLSKMISYDGVEISFPQLFEIATSYIKELYANNENIDYCIYKIKSQEYFSLAKQIVDKNIYISNMEVSIHDMEVLIHDMEAHINNISTQQETLNRIIANISDSKSYKIGRAITLPVRVLKRILHVQIRPKQ